MKRIVAILAIVITACATRRTSSTQAPPQASENPPDVRARMPDRPKPPQPESKFPPPQQSAEDEKRMSNRPGEPNLLHGEPAILLNGAPFPEKKDYEPAFPNPKRLRYVAAEGSGPGDGTLEHPWTNLQDALCRLEPGDRLVLAAGIYAGSFRVGGACRSGTAEAPIQVFARHAFLKSENSKDVLTVERAHWQFWEVQIALLDSSATGFVAIGPDAHNIAIDQSHIYEGKGPAVRFGPGAADIVLSNCHIHQSTGVQIEAGAARITLINNHLHHNRAASVTIGGGAATDAARGIVIVGNRIHNDRGPALEMSHCDTVTVSRNRLSNYRRDEDDHSGGEAIRVGGGCRDVTFENNSVLEASTALRIDGGAERVFFRRNYIENRLTKESVGVLVEGGRDVHFENNIVNYYSKPLIVNISRGVSIANNLILRPAIGWTVTSPDSVVLFDYNVFGADLSLQASVGANLVSVQQWIKSHMPRSRIVPEADVLDHDLAHIAGFSAADAGKAIDGIAFLGRAPDIGVAER
jgi:hypothetical protein